MERKITKILENIIHEYDRVVGSMDKNAHDTASELGRSYGGMTRAEKGKLQEWISEELAKTAWLSIGGSEEDMEINKKKIFIQMRPAYLEKIKDPAVKSHIEKNIKDYVYKLSVDKHVFIKNKFVIGIECKAYAENAMLKRVLVDFELLRIAHPELSCYLILLESQLGGDYSELKNSTYGSKPSHVIQSYFTFDLNIITLLKGERNIKKPIHKNFKVLTIESLANTMEILAEDMKRFL